VSEQVGEISHEIADMARTLTHFPAFYYWIVQTANDPAAYNQLLDIAWKLALVFGCAFAAEWLIFHLVKRPVALLEAHVPQRHERRRRRWPWPIRHPPRRMSSRSPDCIDGVSVWRAPGSR